jgi:hypothetical protein
MPSLRISRLSGAILVSSFILGLILLSGPIAGQPAKPVKELKIISREEWKAKPPAGKMTPQTPVKIGIHHTASVHTEKDSAPAQLRSIQASHMGKGTNWPDIAYHYFIDAKGQIYKGRADEFKGDTRTEYNPQGFVLVCVLGNFEEQKPNQAQLDALTDMVAYLMQKYQVPIDQVYIHKELAKTLCPGKNLIEYWTNGYIKKEAQAKAAQARYQAAP